MKLKLLPVLLCAVSLLWFQPQKGYAQLKAVSEKNTGLEKTNSTLSKTSSDLRRKPSKTANPLPTPPKRSATPLVINTKGGATVLYGCLVYSDEWDWEVPETFRFGMYSFAENDNQSIESLALGDNFYNYSGVYLDGKYYASNNSSWNVYDATTWEQLENIWVSEIYSARDMTYDPVTGNVYGVTYNGYDEIFNWLSVMDLKTGKANRIAKTAVVLYTLAANSKGELYGIGADGILYAVNKQTAELTEIGSTGFDLAFIQSATFDNNTGELYWAAYFNGGTSALCKVDITTGEPTVLMNFEHGEEFIGLYTLAPDDAPALVTSLSVDFANFSSVSGTLNLIVPEKSFSGNSLSGTVDIELNLNNDSLIEKTGLAPGQTFISDLIYFNPGLNTVNVLAKNDAGKGMPTKFSIWAGYDHPDTVQNLTLTTNNSGQAVISWQAPAGGAHGGYVNQNNLTYSVLRLPDSVLVANQVTNTTVIDSSLSTNMAVYRYAITASANAMKGITTYTAAIPFGESVALPFTETFTDNSYTFNMWTVVNSNGGVQWEQTNDFAIFHNIYGSINTGDGEKGDDWLISPPVFLESEYVYKWSHTVQGMADLIESYRLTMGTSAQPDSHTTVLADFPEFYAPGGFVIDTINTLVVVPADGKYHFGFYEYSNPINWTVIIDNISIVKWIKSSAPQAVNSLTAQAAEKGALSATLSFTAPTTAYNGNALSMLSDIKVYRNGDTLPAHTFANPVPGSLLTWEDTQPLGGTNTYLVVPSNTDGPGVEDSIRVFVGPDTPQAVYGLQLRASTTGNPVLTWSVPKVGVHQGYVDADALRFMVIRGQADTLATDLTDSTFVDADFDNNVDQAYLTYTVVPVCNSLVGNSSTSNGWLFGQPYQAPFKESFADASLSTSVWRSQYVGGDEMALWYIADNGMYPEVLPQDRDGGLTFFNSYDAPAEASAMLVSPYLNLSKLTHPKLTFWFFHIDHSYDNDDYFELMVSANNAEYTALENGEIHLKGHETGWTEYSFLLDDYASADRINLAWKGVSGYGYNLIVDNIKVSEIATNDLEITTLSGKTWADPNQATTFTVAVKNQGLTVYDDYTVYILKGTDTIASLPGVQIPVFETAQFEAELTFPIQDAGKTLSLKAVLASSTDVNASNNKSGIVKVTVSSPTLPSPTVLTGAANGSDAVLAWTAPDLTSGVDMLEGFEGYESFAIDNLGDWTLVDGDGSTTYTFNGVEYANMSLPMAYQVIAPVELGFDDEAINPYAGNKELACFSSTTPPNNDWLISPELNGTAQTIAFMAKSITDQYGLERLTVWYSLTDADTASFVKLSDGNYLEVPVNWTEYTFALPTGAKYFALQCTSNDAFALLIDNVSFTATTANYNLLGFNVYRNNELVNVSPITSASFNDESLEQGSYLYQVSALYESGESVLSNAVTVNIGLSDINPQAVDLVKVYAVYYTIVVEGAIGQTVTVVGLDGRTLYKQRANETLRIPVNRGVYLVKTNSKVNKVVVE